MWRQSLFGRQVAATWGHAESELHAVLKEMLQCRAAPTVTPRHVEVVKWLLHKGLSVAATDSHDLSPLHQASMSPKSLNPQRPESSFSVERIQRTRSQPLG